MSLPWRALSAASGNLEEAIASTPTLLLKSYLTPTKLLQPQPPRRSLRTKSSGAMSSYEPQGTQWEQNLHSPLKHFPGLEQRKEMEGIERESASCFPYTLSLSNSSDHSVCWSLKKFHLFISISYCPSVSFFVPISFSLCSSIFFHLSFPLPFPLCSHPLLVLLLEFKR